MRKATNNYKNHIQYDNKTNTISENAKRNTEASNPILATLKAKVGDPSHIGFGTKPVKF